MRPIIIKQSILKYKRARIDCIAKENEGDI